MNSNVKTLTRENLLRDPILQFTAWLDEARRHPDIAYPDAGCLSTVDPDGSPNGRMVILKSFDERGFVFYTNLHSTKGRSLLARPKAALTFYWGQLGRQVKIQGDTEVVGEEEADAYFCTRPRPAQIAAWASEQSAVLENRSVLDRRVAELTKRFEGQEVPRPPFWTGFRVIPLEIEFWQERPNRLHDRFLFTRTGQQKWEITRLYP